MSTYRLGPGLKTATVPPTFRRPLICEKCFEALGNVNSLADLTDMSPDLVNAMWPEMKESVRRHEHICGAPTAWAI